MPFTANSLFRPSVISLGVYQVRISLKTPDLAPLAVSLGINYLRNNVCSYLRGNFSTIGSPLSSYSILVMSDYSCLRLAMMRSMGLFSCIYNVLIITHYYNPSHNNYLNVPEYSNFIVSVRYPRRLNYSTLHSYDAFYFK